MPVKQLKLEFRPYEAKKKLCATFDLFLAEKGLHDILFRGSRLGKEFRKKKKLVFF
jgi:ribosome biogenesis protein UTP30